MNFKLYKVVLIITLFVSVSGFSQEAFTGEIKMFAGNFAPRGWAFCDGQLLSISSNSALFSLLGTMYGGDGRTTFGLPDLRGRVAVGVGQGSGLSNIRQGQKWGTETTTLTSVNLPAHSHTVNVQGNSSGISASLNTILPVESSKSTKQSKANTVETNTTGAGQAVNNIQPSIGIRYIICLYGKYPVRS